MPKIQFQKNHPSFDVLVGTPLMRALLDKSIPVASSCGGDGVCAKCRIEVLQGMKNLSPENSREAFLRERYEIPRTERLSCQVTVHGDITINTSYW